MKFKIIVLIIFLILSIKNLKAQSYDDPIGIRFGIGGGLGLATKNSPFGYAINIYPQVQYNLSDYLAVNLVTGYSRLLTKDTSPIADYDFIPLKLEIKIFPIIEKVFVLSTVGAGFGTIKNSKTNFTYGAGLGYDFSNGYDISLRYEAYKQNENSSTYQPNNGQFLLSFAYFFK